MGVMPAVPILPGAAINWLWVVPGRLSPVCRSWLRSPDGSAELVDADQIARGIAEGAVANPVRLLGRLLDDLSAAGL
jgi:hypothetical protein